MTSQDLTALDSVPRAALTVSWNADVVGMANGGAASGAFQRHLSAAQSRSSQPHPSAESSGPETRTKESPDFHPGFSNKVPAELTDERSSKPLVRPSRKQPSPARILTATKQRESSRAQLISVGAQAAHPQEVGSSPFSSLQETSKGTIQRSGAQYAEESRMGRTEMNVPGWAPVAPDQRIDRSASDTEDPDRRFADWVQGVPDTSKANASIADRGIPSNSETSGTEVELEPPSPGSQPANLPSKTSAEPSRPGLRTNTENPVFRTGSVQVIGSDFIARSPEAAPQMVGYEILQAASASSRQATSFRADPMWTAAWESMPSDLREMVKRSVSGSVATAPSVSAVSSRTANSSGEALRSLILQPSQTPPAELLAMGFDNNPTERFAVSASASSPQEAVSAMARVASDSAASTDSELLGSDFAPLEIHEAIRGGVTHTSESEKVSSRQTRHAAQEFAGASEGLPSRGVFDLAAGYEDSSGGGQPPTSRSPYQEMLLDSATDTLASAGSDQAVFAGPLPDRKPSTSEAAASAEQWIGSGIIPSEHRSLDQPTLAENTLRNPSHVDTQKPGIIRHIPLDSADAKGVELQIQTVGEQLIIRTQDLLGSLDGESAQWKELQNRLEASGVILMPIESRLSETSSSSSPQNSLTQERHTGCYDGNMDTSNRDHSRSCSTSDRPGSQALDAASTEAEVSAGESSHRNPKTKSRGWWA